MIKKILTIQFILLLFACTSEGEKTITDVASFKADAINQVGNKVEVTGFLTNVPLVGLYQSESDARTYNSESFVRIFSSRSDLFNVSCLDQKVLVKAEVVIDKKFGEINLGGDILIIDVNGGVCFEET